MNKTKSGTDGHNILKQIIELIPHSVFWKDSNLNYLGCNKAFADAAGVDSSEDIVGKSDYELAWNTAEADFYRKCDIDVMEFDYSLLDIEESQHQADNSSAIILTSKIPLHDEAGNACGIVGIYSDITERKEKEERLHLQTVALNSTTEGVLVTDTNGQITWANPAASEICGYSEKELIGNNPRLLLPKEQGQDGSAELLQTIRESKIWSGELACTHKSGEPFFLHLTITPVRNKKGDVTHFVANAVDLTEKKKLEAELEELKRG